MAGIAIAYTAIHYLSGGDILPTATGVRQLRDQGVNLIQA